RSNHVTVFSPDFRRILFSTYIGGGNTELYSLLPMPDGSLWITGSTKPREIPGLDEGQYADFELRSAFALQVMPGEGIRRSYLAGGFVQGVSGPDSVLLNARFCMVVNAPSAGPVERPGSSSPDLIGIGQLACLSENGTDPQYAPIGLPNASVLAIGPSGSG